MIVNREQGREYDRQQGKRERNSGKGRGGKELEDVLERCLLAPHCGDRHRAMACEKFRGLSLPHRQSIIAEQELCANCLRHSDNDVRRKKGEKKRQNRVTVDDTWPVPRNFP